MQHHLRHFLGLCRVGLEERTGANAECLSGKHFFHGIRLDIESDGSQLCYHLWLWVWLDQHLMAGCTTAYQQLGWLIGQLTEYTQREIDLFVSDRAGCQG